MSDLMHARELAHGALGSLERSRQRKHEYEKRERRPRPADGVKAANEHKRAEDRRDERQAIDRQNRILGGKQSNRQADGKN